MGKVPAKDFVVGAPHKFDLAQIHNTIELSESSLTAQLETSLALRAIAMMMYNDRVKE